MIGALVLAVVLDYAIAELMSLSSDLAMNRSVVLGWRMSRVIAVGLHRKPRGLCGTGLQGVYRWVADELRNPIGRLRRDAERLHRCDCRQLDGGVLFVFDMASGSSRPSFTTLYPEENDVMSNDLRWYVLNTYSGYELQARNSLLKLSRATIWAHGEPTEESILVPSEDVESMVAGKARVRKRKFFPGTR